MENEVWSEISAFLNNLRCGDVSRKSYLHFPELEEAEKIRKVKKANFEKTKCRAKTTNRELFRSCAALGIYGRRTGILSRICGLYSVVRWLGGIE